MSKKIFKEKKFVYTHERRLVRLFVKKIEHQTIIMYVFEKKIARTKKKTKTMKCLKSPFFCLKKQKFKKKKNAMQPKLVGRRKFVLVYCFLVCMKDSRKY